jgi:phage repressor protein C with HTH and peptisase S24 domain
MPMNEQMKRLYEAADTLRGIKGQSDVARALNASPQTINNWEARGISKSGMIKAQAIFGCSASWLESGEGEMTIGPGAPAAAMGVSVDPDDQNSYRIRKVRLQLRAGVTGFQTFPEIRDGGTINLPKNWVDRKGFFPEALIAIGVAGDSMEPRLFEGDIVVINTADRKLVDGEVYAVNFEGEAIIKRLVRERGAWWLFSDNTDQARHRPRSCREGECNIIGRVVWKGSERI